MFSNDFYENHAFFMTKKNLEMMSLFKQFHLLASVSYCELTILGFHKHLRLVVYVLTGNASEVTVTTFNSGDKDPSAKNSSVRKVSAFF